MTDDEGRGLFRRDALKLAGGVVAGAGGVATATQGASAAEPDRTKYVVYAPLTEVAGGGQFYDFVGNAVDRLADELAYPGDIEFLVKQISVAVLPGAPF